MMKIVHRQPNQTADVSSARGSAGRELWQLVLSAVALLVILFSTVSFTVDFIVTRISFSTEAKVFNSYKRWEQTTRAAPDQSQTERAQIERAEAILSKLINGSNVPPLPYEMVVVKERKPNAYAFPGGTIGVTTGLLEALDEEIEMAFVLGHELGHYYGRDHLQGFGRAISFRIILATIFGAEAGANTIGDLVEFVVQRDYSQKSEKEADRFGLKLVFATYGKVEGGDRLFQLLLEEDDETPGWAYMFSTHPSPRERIDDLKVFATTLRAEP